MVVRFFPTNSFELGNSNSSVSVGLHLTLDANIHIEYILEKLGSEVLLWDYNDDLKSQYIEMKEPVELDFGILALSTIDNLSEIVGPKAVWASGFDGLVQLLCIKMISEKLKEEEAL